MPRHRLIPDVVTNQTLVYLPSQAPVREAVRVMVERHVAAVLVIDSGRLLGIFTERDVTSRIVAADRDPDKTLLAEVMSSKPDTLEPEATALEALSLMESRHIRHLPVVSADGTVWGIVSIRDLFAVVRDMLEEEIHDRDEFILGTGYSLQPSP